MPRCVCPAALSTSVVSPHTDEFLELLASSQSRRLDDQRASASELPGLRLHGGHQPTLGQLLSTTRDLDEDFFDILIKCQVSANSTCSCASCSESTAFVLCFKIHIDLPEETKGLELVGFFNYPVAGKCSLGIYSTVTI